jgi:hypothetical protein
MVVTYCIVPSISKTTVARQQTFMTILVGISIWVLGACVGLLCFLRMASQSEKHSPNPGVFSSQPGSRAALLPAILLDFEIISKQGIPSLRPVYAWN